MAHEMKIKLLRMNVVVGVAKFERISKSDVDLQPLITAARASFALKPPAVNEEVPAPVVETAA